MPINGHSRKGSLLVGEGVDIKKGPLAFGSVDSPNPLLSSSPAAPSLIGGHLADSVQTFGSVPADSSSPGINQDPRRSNMTTSAPTPNQPAKKPMDVHQFFTKSASNPNNSHNSAAAPTAQPPSNPSPVTSPPINGHQQMNPAQSQFRGPPVMAQGQLRPNGAPYQPRPMPVGQPMPPYAQHQGMPYQMMGYPPHGYQGGYDQQHYGMPPWQQQQQQQQHQQRGPYAMSPRGSSAGLPPAQPSPAPPSAQLPTNGSVSPAPSHMSRPPSFMQPPSASSIPGTPGRSTQPPPASFSPQPQPSLSGTAPAFQPPAPRKRMAIQIKRPDGTALDLPTPKPSTSTTPEPAKSAVSTPIKVKPSLPVVVKMESEEGKKLRLQQEADKEKIKKEEELYEREKKERKERQAREAEEKRISDEAKAKEEAAAEEKRKADEASSAKEAAEKKDANEAAKKNESDNAEKIKSAQADEDRRAQLTPAPSAPGSPSSSPNPAGLPPKPVAASRRPAALDLKPSTPAEPSALATAKPITDLGAITYNAPIQSPSNELNKDAEPGKFRYDRDFLMQFMDVCQEKPDRLPPLEEIGLEPDTSSGFGRRPGGKSSSGYPSRGLGISGSSSGQTRYPSQGMGSFGTGSFGTGQMGGIRGTTSEQRYQQSKNSIGGRSGSQQGMQQRGGDRITRPPSQKAGGKRAPYPMAEPDVAPLVVSENAWVNSRPDKKKEDVRSPTYVARKVKSLLNKLTQEKFDSITSQILEFANYSVDETNGQSLKLVIKLIFDKATDEAHWSAMYAKLCRRMLEEVDPRVTEHIDGKDVAGGVLFRKYLIGRCQQDFETGWKEREDAVLKANQKKEDDKQTLADHAASAGENSEPAVLSDEYYALQKAKRRGLGLVQLIGELFKMDMVSKNVMKQCFLKLLGNVDDTDEEDIESAIKLLTTIGESYDKESRDNVSGIMNRLQAIQKKDGVSSRVKFMIEDLHDLRKAHWKGKQSASSVMTIAEIHQQAAREQAQKAAATNASISRQGSRAGQPRAGDWQTPQAAPRQSRPADFSQIGRLGSSTGAPNFAPQSAFQKNRRNGANASTPPISRQPSQANIASVTNANPFALLNDANEAAESSEPAPQRKKLNLKPRTKPVDGEAAEGEDDGEAEEVEESASDDEVTTPVQSTGMTETAAKAKIDIDMKELWGDKDAGGSRDPSDIVHYFRALPETRRPLLVSRLLDDVFRIAKLKDAQLVAKGMSSAVSEGVAAPEQLKTGLETRMVSLDDDSIDFPQAYKAVGAIMRSLSLSAEEIEGLLGKVDVYGEPKITPKMKLDRALSQLDEEAAAA